MVDFLSYEDYYNVANYIMKHYLKGNNEKVIYIESYYFHHEIDANNFATCLEEVLLYKYNVYNLGIDRKERYLFKIIRK